MLIIMGNSSSINANAIEKSSKALLLFFITLTLTSNGLFLALRFKRLKLQMFTRARYSIQTSLAVGGIAHALFDDITSAVLYFGGYNLDDCKASALAYINTSILMPFVYGCGLVMLCLEGILDFKSLYWKIKVSDSVMYSLYCGFLPWLLGLLIVFPFTMPNIDWDYYCVYDGESVEKVIAAICICGILPPVFSILGSLSVFIFRRGKHGVSDRQRLLINVEYNYFEPATAGQVAPPPPYQQAVQDSLQSVTAHVAPEQLPTNYSSFQRESAGNPNDETLSRESAHGTATTVKQTDFRCGNRTLVFSTVVYFMSVIPFNAFMLYVVNNYTPDQNLIYLVSNNAFYVYFCFGWFLEVFYCVLPILWLRNK